MSKIILPVFVFLGLSIWVYISLTHDEHAHSHSVSEESLRERACDAMERTAGLTSQETEACVTQEAGYIAALDASIEVIAKPITKSLASTVAKINDASKHVDLAQFKPVSLEYFVAHHSPIGIVPEDKINNQKLDFSRLTVSGLRTEIGDPDPIADLSYIWVDAAGFQDEKSLMIAITPDLNKLIKDEMSFTCYDIQNTQGGCQGEIYLRTRKDGISLIPTVVALRLKTLSQEQSKATLKAIFEPSFEEGRGSDDARRMRDLVGAFSAGIPGS